MYLFIAQIFLKDPGHAQRCLANLHRGADIPLESGKHRCTLAKGGAKDQSGG